MKINKKLIDYTKVLYDNPTNSSAGSITLNDNVNNYEYLEIYAKSNSGYYMYSKVNASINKFALQTIEGSALDNYYANIKCSNFILNGNKIDHEMTREINIKGSTRAINSISDTQIIFITKVVGIK